MSSIQRCMQPYIHAGIHLLGGKLRDVRSYNTERIPMRLRRVKYLRNRRKKIIFVTMFMPHHIDSHCLSLIEGGGNSLVHNNLFNNKGALSSGAVRHNRILL